MAPIPAYGAFFPMFGTCYGPESDFSPANTDASVFLSYWPMRFAQLAPRLGLAYRLKNPDVVVRAGGGIFYDTALGSLVDP